MTRKSGLDGEHLHTQKIKQSNNPNHNGPHQAGHAHNQN